MNPGLRIVSSETIGGGQGPSFLKTCALNISLEELFPTRKEESDEKNT
jgi:hypothetical protein